MIWFAAIVSNPAFGKVMNGRVYAASVEQAEEKHLGLCPGADMSRVEFVEDPSWSVPSIVSRPGDMAAEYAAEAGIDYSRALVACNMD